jgi:hypothetical protein
MKQIIVTLEERRMATRVPPPYRNKKKYYRKNKHKDEGRGCDVI